MWLWVKSQPYSQGVSGPRTVSCLEATTGAGSGEGLELPEPQLPSPKGNLLKKAAVIGAVSGG